MVSKQKQQAMQQLTARHSRTWNFTSTSISTCTECQLYKNPLGQHAEIMSTTKSKYKKAYLASSRKASGSLTGRIEDDFCGDAALAPSGISTPSASDVTAGGC
ncbi:hypothetical protein J6590_011332 [Homalodisca vitripennis]|nr:hypothetical protein J6590_011332 [Homalodisca vitripennis]